MQKYCLSETTQDMKNTFLIGLALSLFVCFNASAKKSSDAKKAEAAQKAPLTADSFDEATAKERNPELKREDCLYEPREVMLEVHAGLNMSDYSSDYHQTDYRFGPMIGIGADFPIKNIFSIAPELNISVIGAKVNYTDTIRAKERLTYLEIPLYARWQFSHNQSKPFVAIAPTVGIGLGGKRCYEDNTRLMDQSEQEEMPLFAPNQETEETNAIYKKADFGFKIKAGVYVKTKWAVTIGYQLGLVNICNDKYFKEIIPGYYNDRVIVNAPSVKNSNIFATYSYYW